jgi:hypothetical protein
MPAVRSLLIISFI